MPQSPEELAAAKAASLNAVTEAFYGPAPVSPPSVGDQFVNGDVIGAFLQADLQALAEDPKGGRQVLSMDPTVRARALREHAQKQETDAKIREHLAAERARAAELEREAQGYSFESDEDALARLQHEAYEDTLTLEELAAPEPWET